MSAKRGDAPGKTWDRLMAAAQVGDANAYRILLSELSAWLRRYFARRLPRAMTEDAVQDVLLAIHEKRHTYDPTRPFGPWLAAIARYKWIDRLRSLKADAARQSVRLLRETKTSCGFIVSIRHAKWRDSCLQPAQG